MKKILFGSLGLVAVLTASMFFASCKGGADTAIESGGGGGGNRPVQPGKGNETVTNIVVTFDNGWTEAEVTDGADDPYTIFNKIKSVVTPNQNNKTLNAVQNTQLLNEYNEALATYKSDLAAYQAEWADYETAVAEDPNAQAPITAAPVMPVEPPKVLPYFPGESILLESGIEETEGSIPEWDFHVFKGWFDESGTEEITAFTVFDADTTIYAKWEVGFAKPYYTITFDPQNGDSVVRRLAVPTDFTYYADTSNGTDAFEQVALDPSKPEEMTWVTDDISQAEIIEDQAHVAVYADYKITGNQTNSSGSADIPLGYDKIVPEFTREHYTNAVSWKIGNTVTSIDGTKKYTGDTTIYRQWTPKKYTLTFDPNAPAGTTSPAIGAIANIDGPTASSGGLTADSKVLPANPANVKTDADVEYRFTGWNTLADGTGGTFSGATNITDNITVYGKWQVAGVPERAFAYSGAIQTWTVPVNGVYEIELNGAEGGQYGGGLGGKGGYIKGQVYLEKDTVLNVSVGGRGVNGKAATSAGGYNGGGGGGDSANYFGSLKYSGAGGGGATDVRIGGTALNNRIIVAGGGGGNGWNRAGGSGGKGYGGTGQTGVVGNSGNAGTAGGGGTLTAGGTAGIAGKTSTGHSNGSLGTGGHGGKGNAQSDGNAKNMAEGAGGGGGGYYGGAGAFTYNDHEGTMDKSSYSSGGGGGGGSSWASVADGEAPNTSYQFQNVTEAVANTYGESIGHGSAKITWKQPSW
ncbi:MAG: hypothetical protein Ta2F_15950 [Termitinemataceae bacterium]|nr:MAG: hypothetical protein Ta2F_15950 [Termitinemataceae bacterium]